MFMRLPIILLVLIITVFSGCKTIPETTLQETDESPEIVTLSEDEINIIDGVINHIVTHELKNIREKMQVSINNVFYVYRLSYSDSYEVDLINSKTFLKNELQIDEKIISSFIDRNIKRKIVEKNINFRSDFFWKGDMPGKPYFKATFSNIGFDENNTRALIHVCIDLPTWMFAEYVYLEKRNGNWTYNKCTLSWII